MGWLAPIPSSCSPCYPPCPHPLGKGINSLQCPLLAEAWLGYLGAPLWPEFLPPVAPPAGRTSLVRSGSVTAEHHCPGTPPPLTCCQKGFFGGAVVPCPTFHRGIAQAGSRSLGLLPPLQGGWARGSVPPPAPDLCGAAAFPWSSSGMTGCLLLWLEPCTPLAVPFTPHIHSSCSLLPARRQRVSGTGAYPLALRQPPPLLLAPEHRSPGGWSEG